VTALAKIFIRTNAVIMAVMVAIIAAGPALAQDKVKVVATFSILGDMVRHVGGARVNVATLVGANGDAHVYSPTPADARKIGEAKAIFVNGLGFEGWIARLGKAAGAKVPTVVASNGVKPRKMADGHGHAANDPHAWQSLANAKIYVANIRDGLIEADPAGKADYQRNAAAYLGQLDALEREIRLTIDTIPASRRRIITTHDAFGYFNAAYAIEFIAPAGVSTETEMSAGDVAKIITQIRRQNIPAVFLENVSDPRLMRQIARETGARIGGTLYSDALSDSAGPAPTYIDMIRHNIRQLAAALAS
jgi:zinc/manganese transport system substrate-binding protein